MVDSLVLAANISLSRKSGYLFAANIFSSSSSCVAVYAIRSRFMFITILCASVFLDLEIYHVLAQCFDDTNLLDCLLDCMTGTMNYV